MDSDNGILVRYSAPTKYDSAEHKQIWRHILDNSHEHFIQISKDEEKPEWIRMGTFLEKVFESNFYDESFLNACMEKYGK